MKTTKYTQEEIREAHGKVSKDVEDAKKTYKGIALAMECQKLVLDYLTNIMTEEKKPAEEEVEKETEATEEDQAKE